MRFFAPLLAGFLLLPCACARPEDATPGGGGSASRIVCLACAGTDVFAALGALDHLVAVEEDCPCEGTGALAKVRNDDHPGTAAALNLESVLALHPDAVIAKPDLRSALEHRGLRVVYTVDAFTRENIPDLVEKIGVLLGRPKDARALLDRMEATEASIRARTVGLPRVSVYYENYGIGVTVGSRSVIHAMIELAGGRNVAGDLPKATVSLTPEAIFRADADVIVLGAFADPVDVVKARPGWDRLRAVRSGRVHQIPVDRRAVTLGTPRCVEGCETMLLPWLHPELFPPAPGR